MKTYQSFEERLYPELPRLDKEFGLPIHVYDEIGIRRTVEKLLTLTSSMNFKEFFAVKALPVPAILRIFSEYGLGFDCSSIPEVVLARSAGANPEDIMFTSNNTTMKEFELALSAGGCILNLDDVSFLDHTFFEKNGFPKTICFRINPGPLR